MTYQDWLGFMQQYLQSVEKYSSIYSGQQIDTAIGKALNPDTTPTASSSALITSGAVKSALTGVGDNTGVRLSSGDDLNTIIKTGFYSWYGGSASTRPSNLPSLDGVTQNYCSMIVSPMSASGVMQMIFTHGTYKKIARRFLDGSTWGDWEELVTKSALNALFTPSGVPANSDFNTLPTGFYYYTTGSGYPSNGPETNATNGIVATFQVENTRKYQLVFSANLATLYHRETNGEGTSWHSWRKVTSTAL